MWLSLLLKQPSLLSPNPIALAILSNKVPCRREPSSEGRTAASGSSGSPTLTLPPHEGSQARGCAVEEIMQMCWLHSPPWRGILFAEPGTGSRLAEQALGRRVWVPGAREMLSPCL